MATPPTGSDEARKRIAIEVVTNVFYRLGYDIADPEDLRKLAEDLRWASERREAAEQRWIQRSKTVWTLVAAGVAAALGPPITLMLQWVMTGKHGGQ